MMALQYRKSPWRYAAVRTLAPLVPGVATGAMGLLALRQVPKPTLPGPQWVAVRPFLSGICGSDVATATARGSAYLSPLLSFPFVFGHEVVGEVEEVGAGVRGLRPGDRVVVEPALHCAVRGLADPCGPCRAGHTQNCLRVRHGGLAPGIQTGYCRDTGGGWSERLVAHQDQLQPVPSGADLEVAVLTEPLACCLHAVLSVPWDGCQKAVIIGCGTMGLLTLAALRWAGYAGEIWAVGRHAHQTAWAARLGATGAIRRPPSHRRFFADMAPRLGAELLEPELGKPALLGGAGLVFDCVGSAATLDDALRLAAPRGTVLVVGMPGIPRGVDWTPLWYKELRVRGAYAYGLETFRGERIRTFALAQALLAERGDVLGAMVTHRFPLSRYRDAIACASATGTWASIKTAFDLRREGA